MRNRLLSCGMLLFALLAGAWGNVVVAAFCPHMELAHSCCAMGSAPQSAMSHHDMGDMQMGEMEMTGAMNHAAGSNALGQPDIACEVCISHSQSPAAPGTLREAEQTRRGENATTPIALADLITIVPPFVRQVHSKQYAPPGFKTSRHLLFNIFRI